MRKKSFEAQKYGIRLLSMIPILLVIYGIYILCNFGKNTSIITAVLLVIANILILVAYFRLTQNLSIFKTKIEYNIDENNVVHVFNNNKEIVLDQVKEIYAFPSSLFSSMMYCLEIKNGKKKLKYYSTSVKRDCRFMECSTYHFFKFVLTHNKQLKNVKNKQGTFNTEWYKAK